MSRTVSFLTSQNSGAMFLCHNVALIVTHLCQGPYPFWLTRTQEQCFSVGNCKHTEKDKYIIYFFEVNTKYISSSAVKKISIFHECIAQVKMLIFSQHEIKYIWYLPKKIIFSLFYTKRKYRNHNLTFYLVVSHLIWLLQCVYWV